MDGLVPVFPRRSHWLFVGNIVTGSSERDRVRRTNMQQLASEEPIQVTSDTKETSQLLVGGKKLTGFTQVWLYSGR